MQLSSPRRPVHRPLGLALGLTLALGAVACSEGDKDNASGFGGSFSASQATQPSQASADPSATSEPTTGGTDDPASTGAISGVTEEPDPGTTEPATTNPDPSTTTNPDPSTTNPDPSTTTNPDPSTTNPDPSTTNPDPSTTTGDPPDPPAKDPQPVDGLYEPCVGDTCNLALTDGCFTITDENDKIIDGYCTILCNNVNDCGPAPKAPAVQECLTINLNPMQKVCALKCNGVADCPTGMACTGLSLPNNAMGKYCT